MKWQDYEFDEAYRPSGFEEWSQEKVNVGYAFYLRDKYITDDTGLYEDTDEGTIHIFCPHFGETFEEDERVCGVYDIRRRSRGYAFGRIHKVLRVDGRLYNERNAARGTAFGAV